MKATIKIEKEVELKTLIVQAGVLHWEDTVVNGVEDTEGDLIPCRMAQFRRPIIDIDSGVITNWKQGTTAEIHYKVSDCCAWTLLDDCNEIVSSAEDSGSSHLDYDSGSHHSSHNDSNSYDSGSSGSSISDSSSYDSGSSYDSSSSSSSDW